MYPCLHVPHVCICRETSTCCSNSVRTPLKVLSNAVLFYIAHEHNMPDIRQNCPLPVTYNAEQEFERHAVLGKETFFALLSNGDPFDEIPARGTAVASNTEYVEAPDENLKGFDAENEYFSDSESTQSETFDDPVLANMSIADANSQTAFSDSESTQSETLDNPVLANKSIADANSQTASPEDAPLIVVLDLDETLVHSLFEDGNDDCCEAEEIQNDQVDSFCLTLADGDAVTVNQRPNLAAFLNAMETEFHAHIFTAAMKSYAEPVINRLDAKQTIFKRRLYRDDCSPTDTGMYKKDLSKHYKDLSRVVLVDNNAASFVQEDNGLLVPSFYADPADNTLSNVLDALRKLAKEKDIRPAIRKMREPSDPLTISEGPGHL